jgi:hypothetical protein
MLIVGLRHCWGKIQQRCSTGGTHHNRLAKSLRHPQGIERRGSFISDWIAYDVRALVEIMYDR